MRWRRALQILVVIIWIVTFIAVVYLKWQAGTSASLWLYDIILAFMTALGSLIFKPIRDWLVRVFENLFTNQLPGFRILVYGLGRSGKSTIIDRFLTVRGAKKARMKSTPAFTVQTTEVLLSGTHKKYSVSIADYKGQQPSEIITDAPESFFGAKGQRKINAILFVVDLFPEPKDNDGNIEVDDDVLIKRYAKSAKQLIEKQVNENQAYLNKYTFQPVFNVSYSKENLIAVRLLINKADILQEIMFRGYVSNKSVYDYAIELYAETIEAIEKYCGENEIDDFAVEVISAGRGLLYTEELQPQDIDTVFGELLEVYRNRQGG